ncbi:MAG: Gx transporter family protein [Deferribacteres bacterium]|nr:Gx transporter family protein [Deferribacteres bacterium]
MKQTLGVTHKVALLGLFLALGMILAFFEMYIPRPLPWAKLGLANVVTVVLIYLFGFRDAIMVSCARVVLVNFFTGGFGGPAFGLALAASLFSTVAMFLAITMTEQKLGPIGISMIGAYVHIFIQLLLAAALIIGQMQVFYLLPFFMLPTFFSGLLVGIFALLLLQELEKRFVLKYRLPA